MLRIRQTRPEEHRYEYKLHRVVEKTFLPEHGTSLVSIEPLKPLYEIGNEHDLKRFSEFLLETLDRCVPPEALEGFLKEYFSKQGRIR